MNKGSAGTTLVKAVKKRAVAYAALHDGNKHFTADFGYKTEVYNVQSRSNWLRNKISKRQKKWAAALSDLQSKVNPPPSQTPEGDEQKSIWYDWWTWTWGEINNILKKYLLKDSWSANLTEGRDRFFICPT